MDQLERWAERLSNNTVSLLTRDFPEPSQSSPESTRRPIEAWETIEISPDAQDALQKLYENQINPSFMQMSILSAFIVLVSRLTGDDDVTLGMRNFDGILFVLRISVDLNEAFSSFLARVEKLFFEFSTDAVSTERLREYLKQSVLYKIGFHASLNASQECLSDTTDLIVCLLEDNDSETKRTISSKHNIFTRVQAIYNQRLFSSARITFVLAQLMQLVQDAAWNPHESVGKLNLLSETQRRLLPDPRKDLHWSSFRGAIHDIFATNAENHPERLCVVETATKDVCERHFTYRHIHEASNILAHHLISSGIQRGEVVMIYAYRGVDLVVSIMGVLKAGATFSVIDPLYPSDRQIIYLEVAQPRALINLKKATQEAGQLSDNVRTFIKDKLDLRTEIPALFLQDDGILIGGMIDGKDILHSQRELKSRSIEVVIGPDDIPTLSFTSGSEGRPKGVKGRHFSLAYYFPWMAQRFHLSDKDKFTMLSGIAHDPIQRDIFTPLFLGAQLLVPSREDIQNGKLAEWMKRYGATVTHLTPAMGQILVGNATAEFPDLHHAFFVGDVLIKRDCKSLQRLACNVKIVNMYGTTETQRAVSYFEIPSFNDDSAFLNTLKDVIPAGRGMSDDVQLLVINRTNPFEICGIGEVGEIYVRAGGLAEGYLGQDELTERKFRLNWFVDPKQWINAGGVNTSVQKKPWMQYYLGPRDRLYRSGDLGRYMPTGDVECSGRADDQVKIRGFRIELGDIDTNLSKHPLIRENVTLVRRNKDEEKMLVSYVVPEMKIWSSWLQERGLQDEPEAQDLIGLLRRFRPLRDDAREYLKTKLPVYAVPSTIITLLAMPLNPNGKIDKPALPFPSLPELSAAMLPSESGSSSGLSDTEKTLATIWAELLHIENHTIGSEQSFFDLGGNSLKGNEMVFKVRKTLRVEVSMSAIFRSPTLKDFALFIDRLRNVDVAHPNLLREYVADGTTTGSVRFDEDYAADAKRLLQELPSSFTTNGELDVSRASTVFLTGATGFLGAFILRELLSRGEHLNVVLLVRAKSDSIAMSRILDTCRAYNIWNPAWVSRVRCVTGNLGDPKLGLRDEVWKELGESVDVVIHNGALVHWVFPYSKLKAPNVLGTLDAIKFCAFGRSKTFIFVSSTSVLDSEHYVQLSDRLCSEGKEGIPETDDLEGSSTGLDIGYAQVKWVGEYLTKEAGRRGLQGAIVRPGYISGDSRTGVTNIDDFLIRMLKGCIQLSARPDINNTLNMCPVDFVARLIVASAFHPTRPLGVINCNSHPRLRFNEYLGMLEECGYNVPQMDYIPWRVALEHYVAEPRDDKHEQHALLPLYHFVTADLPTSSKSPELDDHNAIATLEADINSSSLSSSSLDSYSLFSHQTHPKSSFWDSRNVNTVEGSSVSLDIMRRYVAWLVKLNFLPAPNAGAADELPLIEMGEEQRKALWKMGGRGGGFFFQSQTEDTGSK